MSGVAFAITAGVAFGLFQPANRRANQGIDPYFATFGLLLTGTVGMIVVSLRSQDLDLLTGAPVSSVLFFAGAGIVHFFFGWTLLSLSQQRFGAARTGATAAATPLFGGFLAALVLDEGIGLVIGGVVLVVVGVVVLSLRGSDAGTSLFQSIPWLGLGAALCWGTSPLFIRWGLEGLPAPLLGVTVGMATATLSYAIVLSVTRRWKGEPIPRRNVRWVAVAGVIGDVAIASQWTSYDRITIATALTLMQLSVPVVIVSAPFIVGGDMERITSPLVVGTALVMAGSMLAILAA